MPILAYEVNTRQIHTPVFDGPLELLLYLVRRKGVDIRFVKIAPITDAFLHHLTQMHEMQLDIAGEFLLLASTLCYLKSCELLPGLKVEDEEESEEESEEEDEKDRKAKGVEGMIEVQNPNHARKGQVKTEKVDGESSQLTRRQK